MFEEAVIAMSDLSGLISTFEGKSGLVVPCAGFSAITRIARSPYPLQIANFAPSCRPRLAETKAEIADIRYREWFFDSFHQPCTAIHILTTTKTCPTPNTRIVDLLLCILARSLRHRWNSQLLLRLGFSCSCDQSRRQAVITVFTPFLAVSSRRQMYPRLLVAVVRGIVVAFPRSETIRIINRGV